MTKPFKNERANKLFWEVIILLAFFLFTSLSYLAFKPLFHFVRNGVVAQSFTAILLAILIGITVFLGFKKKLTFERVIIILFVAGFLIKLGYMLFTPYNCRQYDTVSSNHNGHQDYAWILYTTGKLPTENDYQFYHPPLNALMQSVFMHVFKYPMLASNTLLKTSYDVNNMNDLYGSVQILSVMYMLVTSWTGIKIVNEFNISKNAKAIGYIFMIFFPRFVQLSAQENNDAICIMFSFLSILYSIRYWKNKSWGNLIAIALTIGLAMMSKISGAIICVTPAIIFVYEFVKAIIAKDKKLIWTTVIKYLVFLAICAPIGLWFQVYAKIRFDQPLGFVFSNLNHKLYTGDYNFFQRFINLFEFKDVFKMLYANAFENYNIPAYLIKSSVLGEFSFWQGEGFAVVAIISNYIFVLSTIVLFVVYLIKTRKSMLLEKVVIFSILATQLLSMMYFNIKMPYGCTMDFRYIVPITISYAGILAVSYDTFKENNGWGYFYRSVAFFAGLMLLSSSLFYMVCI